MDNQDNNNTNERRHSFKSTKTTLIVIVIVVVAYLLYAYVFSGMTSCSGTTTGKTPLDESDVTLTDYVFGKSDYSDSDSLAEAMVNFYTASGIQPILYDLTGEDALTEEELAEKAEKFYKETVTDEGHFLLAFQANGSEYVSYTIVGSKAQTILNDDAITIFNSCLKEYFSSKSVSDVLTYTYTDSNSKIMGRSISSVVLIVIVIVVLIFYGGFNFMKNKKRDDYGNIRL